MGNNGVGRMGALSYAFARVVKLVDTRDLKSLGAIHAGSTPAPGTIALPDSAPDALKPHNHGSERVQKRTLLFRHAELLWKLPGITEGCLAVP